VFCVDLRINNDYFPTQRQVAGFYNRDGELLLRGTHWVFVPFTNSAEHITTAQPIPTIKRPLTTRSNPNQKTSRRRIHTLSRLHLHRQQHFKITVCSCFYTTLVIKYGKYGFVTQRSEFRKVGHFMYSFLCITQKNVFILMITY